MIDDPKNPFPPLFPRTPLESLKKRSIQTGNRFKGGAGDSQSQAHAEKTGHFGLLYFVTRPSRILDPPTRAPRKKPKKIDGIQSGLAKKQTNFPHSFSRHIYEILAQIISPSSPSTKNFCNTPPRSRALLTTIPPSSTMVVYSDLGRETRKKRCDEAVRTLSELADGRAHL